MRDNYFDSKALSKSAIDLLLECPALYKVWRDGEEEEKATDALIFGSMFHTLTLEPKKFDATYAIKTMSLSTKAGKEWRSSLPQGVTLIKEEDYETALGMREAVYSHPQAKYLFENYEAEKSIYWTRQDGIECKCKPDVISDCSGVRFLADVKSTDSVNPKSIERTIMKYHYYRQASWYLEGLKAIGKECTEFIFIFVEKKYPFLVTLCTLDATFLSRGKEECEKAVELLKTCKATNTYPCYTKEIITISHPTWAV